MRKFYTRKPQGDTLIEVIFAFAILATIIGFAYTGAIQARKTAVSAQQRTQALLMAQYQSQALKAYRESLPWDNTDGDFPSFKVGGNTGNDEIITGNDYCLKSDENNGEIRWALRNQNTTPNYCIELTSGLTAPPSGEVIQIKFSAPKCGDDINVCDAITANIKIVWIDPYGQEASVTNIVQLTKS